MDLGTGERRSTLSDLHVQSSALRFPGAGKGCGRAHGAAGSAHTPPYYFVFGLARARIGARRNSLHINESGRGFSPVGVQVLPGWRAGLPG